MKMKLAAIAAVASLGISQAASAQVAGACITERELSNLAIYAVPSLVEGVRGKCAPSLSPNGFLATRGDGFAAKYAALQAETWPGAKSAMTKFAAPKAKGEAADSLAMLAGLPDDAVRPLVDALIAQKIGEEVKIKDCVNIERGMRLLAPLDPRDSGALVGFVLAIVKPDDARICPVRS
jgi:hypothetical protein